VDIAALSDRVAVLHSRLGEQRGALAAEVEALRREVGDGTTVEPPVVVLAGEAVTVASEAAARAIIAAQVCGSTPRRQTRIACHACARGLCVSTLFRRG